MNLGPIHSGPELEEALFDCSSQSRNRRPPKRSFDRSVDHVKRNQHTIVCNGWNPKKPHTEAARAMHTRVAKNLPRGKRELRLFVSIGTTLDVYYGVDAFFEYRGVIVTIDVTISRYKKKAKADFVLTASDFQSNDLYKKLDAVAAEIMEKARQMNLV